MKNKFTIGQMSKLHNISVHTLRYYDKIGLLLPSYVDSNTNYRYYDEYDSYKLEKIKVLKSVGLPINKIRMLLEGNIDEVEKSFYDIRKTLVDKICNLNEVVAYLDEQLNQIQELKSGNCYIEPKILKIPKREGYLINVNESSTIIERIEALVDFDKKNNTNSDVFFKPSRLMYINSNGERFLKNYLALKRSMSSCEINDLYILQDGYYGVIDHIGHYKNINESYNKLLNYINKSGMSIGNEAIEILVITSNITVRHEEWRTQIQIPVKIKNRV